MAEKLIFDSGVIELDVNGNGLLRFNPSDPNVYRRFYELAKELPVLEKEYEAKTSSEQVEQDEFDEIGDELGEMRAMDADIKGRLTRVFGEGNDIDLLLGGVNIMAFGSNGERVISNLLNALTPYIEAGAKKHAQAVAETAVQDATLNREQRRALK